MRAQMPPPPCERRPPAPTRFECLGVIMFFRKDLPQTEGRRDADPGIKTSPASTFLSGHACVPINAIFSRNIASTRCFQRWRTG